MKQIKIGLINRYFDSISDQVAPAGYLLYLYTASLFRDIKVRPLFKWLKSLNEERVRHIRRIYAAGDMTDILAMRDELGALALSPPELPEVIVKDSDYTFGRTASSYYNRGPLNIAPESSVSISYDRKVIPICASIEESDSDIQEYTLTNHEADTNPVMPSFVVFRDVDGDAIPATSVLQNWVELSETHSVMEITVASSIRLTGLSLYVSGEGNIDLIIGSKIIQRNSMNSQIENSVIAYRQSIDAQTQVVQVDLKGNSRVGHLTLYGRELSKVQQIERYQTLSSGRLTINSVDDVEYSIEDRAGQVLRSGRCNTSIAGIVVPDQSRLIAKFGTSSTPKSLWAQHDPDSAEVRVTNVYLTLSADRDKLTVHNPTDRQLVGRLRLLNPVEV